MKTKVLSLFALLAFSFAALGQQTSQRSNTIQVDFKSDPPTISWVTPSSFQTSIKDKKYDVKVGVSTTSKLKSAELYVNDQLVGESRGFKVAGSLADKFDKYIERTVDLQQGDNILKLVAINEDGVEATDTRMVRVEIDVVAAIATETPRIDRALLFGGDEYDEWSNLFNPVKDVTTIGKELEESYGFEVDIQLNLTTSEIMGKLREYAGKSYLPDDQLFVMFAGHGQFDEVFTEGYIVGRDSKLSDPGKTSYISHSTLNTVINNIPSNHTFLVMDACFGGTFDPLVARAGSRGQDDLYQDIAQAEFIKRKLRFKTRQYVTSGGKEYVADGRPGGHSPFAAKFLEALRNYGGRDKVITLSELYDYLQALRMEPHAGTFGENAPGSDFVFVAR